jgi:hypothetical protein
MPQCGRATAVGVLWEWLGVLTRAYCYGSSRNLACNHASLARLSVFDYARLGDEISLHVKIATQGGGCLERKNKDT